MKVKRNILFVEYCPDLKAGGAQRVFLDIIKSFSCEKYNIHAAYPKSEKSELSAEIPEYVTRLDYDSKSPNTKINKLISYSIFLIYIPIILIRWYSIIKRLKIDVVYVHSIITGFHFSILKYFIDYKLIYHEHNMASQRPNSLIWKSMFQFVAKRSDKLIAISKEVALSLEAFDVEKQKIIVVHNGLELIDKEGKELYQKGAERLKIKQEDILVGMIGHFRPWKGQKIFIESLKTVLQADQNVCYIVVGGVHDEGYYQEVLDYIQQNNLTDKVIITGHQDNIPELMARLDIIVVPSVPEPFGLVVLEAMMMKKSVIAFDMGGPAEIIEDNKTGILVKDVNSYALGEAIVALASNKKTRDLMGNEGRNRLENTFTLQIQAEKIEHMIDEMFSLA